MPRQIRVIEVSRQWFEELENHLHPVERFMVDGDFNSIYMLTLSGDTLKFTIKKD